MGLRNVSVAHNVRNVHRALLRAIRSSQTEIYDLLKAFTDDIMRRRKRTYKLNVNMNDETVVVITADTIMIDQFSNVTFA